MFFIVHLSSLNAQNNNVISNQIIKKVSTNDSIVLHNQSIVPNSFVIEKIDTSYYNINYFSSILYFKKKVLEDSLLVKFRVFNFSFSKSYQQFNYDSIKYNFFAKDKYIPYIYNSNTNVSSTNASIDFGKLNYNGSFGRNISFGNNQDAVFNSQLNLNLNGYVGDSIEMNATITDNNIPIQPDGTSQRINEFDRILLQFKKKNTQLSLGDIDLRQNKNYFLNFYKRLQGISLNISKNNNHNFNLTGAIARGKFNRYVFNGQEGNQGPYRLQGANGETFFIVLANTERVFVDGELLKRGEDLDYIINYNTGEVLFTPKRTITKDKRIQIEFEYAERSYLNSMIYASNQFSISKKLDVSISFYNNSDAKNSPINQQLDVNQKQFLANLGNNFQQAFYPFATIDSFSVSKILYKKVVNPNNNNDSIYVYSTNKDSARYNLNFIEVGANKGNYISFFNGANGKVYQYVSPINNLPQGNFEPALFLVTPKKQQIISVGTNYKLKNNIIWQNEFAYSNFDVNTLSSLNKAENKGFALKSFLQKNSHFNEKYTLQTLVQYEYVNQNFKPIERLRPVEFARDWGLPILPNQATEHLPKLVLVFSDKNNNSLQLSSEAYIRNDGFEGYRQQFQINKKLNQWLLKSNISYNFNSTLINDGFFFKPIVDLSKRFKNLNNIEFSVNYSLENNQQKNKLNDSLTANSFWFETISANLKSNNSNNNKWSISYFTRSDKLPLGKEMIKVDRSNNYNFSIDLFENEYRLLRLNATYRELNIYNENLTNLKPDKSLLNRTEYTFTEWNGFINGYVLYEIGAGQEQRRDFSYVEVPAGRGQYTWNDYNNDGIAQLNEFEISPFLDQAKYIRIFTPTNQFIKANYNTFNYSLNIQPKVLAKNINNKFIKTVFEKFGIISSLQTNNKITSQGNFSFNPFVNDIEDTALINTTKNFTNTFLINRASSIWGVDISLINNNSKSLLTYGVEARTLRETIIKTRYNFIQKFSSEVLIKFNNNNLSTPSFANRNFAIEGFFIEPKISYVYQTLFRIQISHLLQRKKNNELLGGEESLSKSLSIETKYNNSNSSSLQAKFTYAQVSFMGARNTTTSFIMLDGLLPGKNYLWNIDFTKRLKNNFELSLSYEGRKVGESRLINIGRASIRAIL